VSGSDAIEAAVDMARKVTGGVDILALHMGLHGSTSFITRSLSFGWNRGKLLIVIGALLRQALHNAHAPWPMAAINA
jgi:2,2-dialkylglycine decarboxylase (pyruvate)